MTSNDVGAPSRELSQVLDIVLPHRHVRVGVAFTNLALLIRPDRTLEGPDASQDAFGRKGPGHVTLEPVQKKLLIRGLAHEGGEELGQWPSTGEGSLEGVQVTSGQSSKLGGSSDAGPLPSSTTWT